jgi:hypothetical protein
MATLVKSIAAQVALLRLFLKIIHLIPWLFGPVIAWIAVEQAARAQKLGRPVIVITHYKM